MDPTTDLSAALGFVIRRIVEEAMRSGEPLKDEHRFLLNNLPTKPDAPVFNTGDPELSMDFVPRDTTYERLCALAKAAHRGDVELNPGTRDWQFAPSMSRNSIVIQCVGSYGGRASNSKGRGGTDGYWLLLPLLWIIATMLLMLLVIDRE